MNNQPVDVKSLSEQELFEMFFQQDSMLNNYTRFVEECQANKSILTAEIKRREEKRVKEDSTDNQVAEEQPEDSESPDNSESKE